MGTPGLEDIGPDTRPSSRHRRRRRRRTALAAAGIGTPTALQPTSGGSDPVGLYDAGLHSRDTTQSRTSACPSNDISTSRMCDGDAVARSWRRGR